MPKTVLVTGASRGIGAAIARRFAQEGYQVALNFCQNQSAAQALADALAAQGHKALPFQADVADRAQVHNMVQRIEYHLGPVDVLVNNAGIAQQKLFCDLTAQDWQRMVAVNLTGPFNCCQEVLPGMIERQCGKIVNLSSIWGLVGASCEVHYSAVKAGVIGLTRALAKEMGPSHIQVNCVAPGVVDTDMNALLDEDTLSILKDETPLGTLGQPEDIAQAVYFLASPAADFITGQVLSPNGGFVI